MTDLANTNSTPDLTAYNCDDMELYFDSNRKVRASQSALARMCKVTETTVRNDLKTLESNGTILDVVYAQGRSMTEESRSKLHNSSTIKALLKKRNPELLEQFSEWGINDALANMAGVPVQSVTKVPEGYVIPKTSDLLAIAAQLAKENENRQDFLRDKPGLQKMDDLAKTDRSKLLAPGKFIIRELALEFGVNLTRPESAGLSSMLTLAVLTQNLERPTKRKIVTKDGNNPQWYFVNEYSYDIRSVAIDCMKHLQLI